MQVWLYGNGPAPGQVTAEEKGGCPKLPVPSDVSGRDGLLGLLRPTTENTLCKVSEKFSRGGDVSASVTKQVFLAWVEA